MPSSELSDALNPNVVQSRRYEEPPQFNHPPQPYAQNNTVVYVPHRSELELAVVEPCAPPRPRNINPIQELLRILATTREAEQNEKKRRLAWEQEQEAKSVQAQAENERRFQDMQQEIAGLKEYISFIQQASPPTSFSGHNTASSSGQEHVEESLSPTPPLTNQYSTFVHGSSTMGAPRPIYVEGASSSSLHNGLPVDTGSTYRRKRPSPSITSTDDESVDEESNTCEVRPLKRANGHDNRCLTIQHAMRLHIYRCMITEEDKHLPYSHIEGAPLGNNEPVRFIWERTVKQSPHNARMRARIIADMIKNRQLYPHVPDKDFVPDSLDSVFDQAFSTLRQKFRVQRDDTVALKRHKREATKSSKVRRTTRKRAKLGNRTTSRQKLDIFSHPTFDGALQLDCMSSEESEGEASDRTQVLRVRGLPWRSSRLIKLYNALDEEYLSRATVKRGVALKEKYLGPMKEGYLVLPPKGVAGWMISKFWLRNMSAVHKDLEQWLKPLLLDPPGFDWYNFRELGDATEDEDTNDTQSTFPSRPVVQHTHVTSSSLQYALHL